MKTRLFHFSSGTCSFAYCIVNGLLTRMEINTMRVKLPLEIIPAFSITHELVNQTTLTVINKKKNTVPQLRINPFFNVGIWQTREAINPTMIAILNFNKLLPEIIKYKSQGIKPRIRFKDTIFLRLYFLI